MRTVRLIALAATIALGCSKNEASDAVGSAAPMPAPATAAPKVSADPGPASDAKPVLGPGRTNVPTLDEWNTQRKEVTVKGSSALGCESKMVREYLRVACRGKNDSGGTPTSVRVVKGGRGEVLSFGGVGVTSLITPFVQGTDLEAEFSWTDKSHKLVLHWPEGTPRPTVIGAFKGANSPLDGTDEGDSKKLCACHKKVTGQPTCDDMMGGADPDCDRTYGNDCDMLLACSRGEPGAFPRCLPGFTHAGPMARCRKICGPGMEECPAGRVCSRDDISSMLVCRDP